MRFFAKNAIMKKILIALIIVVMLSNFIMPNYVQAKSVGEKLVEGFFYLIAYIGDAGISTMQNIMVGTKDIKDSSGEYSIKYSPGIIFSGEVLALDVNFLSPREDTIQKETTKEEEISIFSRTWETRNGVVTPGESGVIHNGETTQGYNHAGPVITNSGGGATDEVRDTLLQEYGYNSATDKNEEGTDGNRVYTWTSDGVKYQLTQTRTALSSGLLFKLVLKVLDGTATPVETDTPAGKRDALLEEYGYNKSSSDKIKEADTTSSTSGAETIYEWKTAEGKHYKLSYNIEGPSRSDWSTYTTISLVEITTKTSYDTLISSPANELQNGIANWYIGLRTIALVGLLSVLVYVGIRIILSSSSANDKAKYKNMLKDWVVAICILFMLHYAMAFMLQITGQINSVIKAGVIEESADKLMSTVRTTIGEDLDSAWDVAGYTVMYLSLVILTGIFTIQYLKRVVYMAFLTMIAPMIALTYPLDKIKDGKAQAFSFWLREYIFNCLIQPVHLLLYSMLIGNAIDFATENILYAIVALAFLVPAEKFIKEMFGMKSSSPVGTLGAAAGGALVMNMLNKMRARPHKGGAGAGPSGDNSSGAVRTATRNGASGAAGGAGVAGAAGGAGASGAAGAAGGAGTTGVAGGAGTTGAVGAAGAAGAAGTTGAAGAAGAAGGAGTTGAAGAAGNARPSRSFGRGIGAIGKKYIYGADAIKSHGKKFTRAVGGGALAAAAGTIALAAQVADGDLIDNPEKAFTEIGVTAGIGYAAGNTLTGNTLDSAHNLSETYKQGAYGEDAYNNMKFDKAFYKSKEYKNISTDSALLARYGDVQGIRTATQQFLDNGITDAGQIKTALQEGISGDEYKEYSKAGLSVGQMSKVKTRASLRNLNTEQLRHRLIIANAVKNQGISPQGMIQLARTVGITDPNDIRNLRNEIQELI